MKKSEQNFVLVAALIGGIIGEIIGVPLMLPHINVEVWTAGGAALLLLAPGIIVGGIFAYVASWST